MDLLIRLKIVLILWYGFAPEIVANGAVGELLDCSQITIDYEDDEELTEDERLARMERALNRSLNQFDLCQTTADQAAQRADGGDHRNGNGDGDGDGDADGAALSDSEDMDGDTAEPASPPPHDPAAHAATPKTTIPATSEANGALPEDITPVADNDDRVAAQIRLAAELAQDPEKKKKLWNEYRKYKGLPVED